MCVETLVETSYIKIFIITMKTYHSLSRTVGPSANMALECDFEKVLILRAMELGQTG